MYAKYINTNIIFVFMHRTRQWNGQYECCHSNKNKAFHYSNITDRTGLQQHKGALVMLAGTDKSLHFYFIVPVLTPYINQ